MADPRAVTEALARRGLARGPIISPQTNVNISTPRQLPNSLAGVELSDARDRLLSAMAPVEQKYGSGWGAALAGALKGVGKYMERQGAEKNWELAKDEYLQEERDRAQEAAQAEAEKYARERADKLADDQAKREHDMRLVSFKQSLTGGEKTGPDIDGELKFAKDWYGLTKDFAGQNDAYGRIVASANDPSPAGDLALIFNYMKLLDPGSTVREGEFAQAAASGSYGERLKAAGQAIISGQRLSEEQRADFLTRSGRLYHEALKNFDARRTREQGRAGQYNFDPERSVPDRALYRSDMPPPGVSWQEWSVMTPEEKSAWQN